jgi:hypothetical protein
MKKVLRSAVYAGVSLVALMGVVSPAQAVSHPISGTFYFSDLLAQTQRNDNAQPGVCYSAPSLALSASNRTNARVVLYSDQNCSLFGKALEPGNHITDIFTGYRFDEPYRR